MGAPATETSTVPALGAHPCVPAATPTPSERPQPRRAWRRISAAPTREPMKCAASAPRLPPRKHRTRSISPGAAQLRAAPPCPRFYCAGTRPRTRLPPYMACPEGAPLGPSPRCPGAGRARAGGAGGEQGTGSCGSPRARKPAQGDVDVVCPDEAILKAG